MPSAEFVEGSSTDVATNQRHVPTTGPQDQDAQTAPAVRTPVYPVGPHETVEGPDPLPGFTEFMETQVPYESQGAPWQYAYWYWQDTGEAGDMPDPEDFE